MDNEALPIVSNTHDFSIILDSFIIKITPQNDCNNNKGNQNRFKEIFPIIPPKGKLKIISHIVINKNIASITSSCRFFKGHSLRLCPIQTNGNNNSACWIFHGLGRRK